MADDPNARKIGTVANINGTTTTVSVNCNMVTTDGPLELLPDQAEKFHAAFLEAYWDAREYERANAGEDGGDVNAAEGAKR